MYKMSYVEKKMKKFFKLQAVARLALEKCEEMEMNMGEVEELPKMIEALLRKNREDEKFSMKLEKPAAEPRLYELCGKKMNKICRRTRHPKLVQLINSNFETGDIAITLSYVASGGETSGVDRMKQFDEFIRNIRKNYRTAGKELKYVAVPVCDLYVSNKIDRVNLIVNGIWDAAETVKLLQDCWKCGKSCIRSVQSHENLNEIAEYMESLRTGRYHISKNIAKAGQ